MLKRFKVLISLMTIISIVSVNFMFDRNANFIQLGKDVFAAPTTITTPGASTWVAPQTGLYKIECWGAQGGKGGGYSDSNGNFGNYNIININLTAGVGITLIIGTQGGAGTAGMNGTSGVTQLVTGGAGGAGGNQDGQAGSKGSDANSLSYYVGRSAGGGGGGGGSTKAVGADFTIIAAGGTGGHGFSGTETYYDYSNNRSADRTVPGGNGGAGGTGGSGSNIGLGVGKTGTSQSSYAGDGKVVITKISNNTIVNVTSPALNQIYSPVNGAISATISGNITGYTSGDTETLYYSIDAPVSQNGTNLLPNAITATGTSQPFSSSNIDLTNLTEGDHSLCIWAHDQNGFDSIETTVPFKVDRTPPAIGDVSVSSAVDSVTVTGSATDKIAGLDPLPYRYTVGNNVSDWISSSTYTQSNLLPNTAYKTKVEARDKAGQISSTVKDLYAYTKAQAPTIAVGSPTSFSLDVSTTDTNPANTEYQIMCGAKYVTQDGTLGDSPSWVVLVNKKITVAGLSGSTGYTFTAKARNGAGEETDVSSAASGTTLPNPPGVPSNISAVSTTSTTTLSWNAVPGATSYDVEIDYNNVVNCTTTQYLHIQLSSGSQHTYRVRAVTSGVPGTWSSYLAKLTLPAAPNAPTWIGTPAVSKNTITVTWNEIADAIGYDVEVDGKIINNGLSNSYTHNGLTPSTEHSYRVRSRNAAGKSDWGTYVTAKTLSDILAVPANINATPASDSIAIIWDLVTGANGYDISVDGVVYSLTTNSYTHTGLLPNTLHKYKVRSKSSAGVGDWSPELVATTTAGNTAVTLQSPSGLTATATNSTITPSWSAVTNATSYDVELDGAIVGNTTVLQYTCTGLITNKSYTIRVRAKNATDTSLWSDPITKTATSGTAPKVPKINATASYTVSWDAIDGSLGYDIEVDGAVLNSGTRTSYIHKDLLPNISHIYRVRSKDASGAGAWSDPFTIGSQGTIPVIGTPTNFSAVPSTTTVNLVWDSVANATGYEVEVDNVVVSSTITTTSYQSTGLLAGTEHTYRVRAKNSTNSGEWTSLLKVDTLSGTAGIPLNIKATPADTSILITWCGVLGATGYDIEVDGSTISVGTTGANISYTHTGLSINTTHSYRVRSKTATTTNPWSAVVTATTKSSGYTVSCNPGETFDIVATASNIRKFDNATFTMTYDSTKLDVTDLCSMTPELNTTAGQIAGSSVNIAEYTPGRIVFKVNKSLAEGQAWSGVLNYIRFTYKPTTAGTTSIGYTTGEIINNSSITPATVAFNLSNQQDVSVTLNLNGNSFNGIMAGASYLTPNVDYTVSGNVLTIKKGYLNYFGSKFMPQNANSFVGSFKIDFTDGTDPYINITFNK